ncbi:unnamed protein product [Leptidea sinapis]|uniref:Uncharacterized protein n=1 Tax=Leptidea sinapis TaxID=189913 RepID=A0A5E4Q4E0_9NEOP|nr:unnamed protein product [Leptidea sinapis]
MAQSAASVVGVRIHVQQAGARCRSAAGRKISQRAEPEIEQRVQMGGDELNQALQSLSLSTESKRVGILKPQGRFRQRPWRYVVALETRGAKHASRVLSS